jgi:hypothetical protein
MVQCRCICQIGSQLCNAKVSELWCLVAAYQHVGRLDVSVDNACGCKLNIMRQSAVIRTSVVVCFLLAVLQCQCNSSIGQFALDDGKTMVAMTCGSGGHLCCVHAHRHLLAAVPGPPAGGCLAATSAHAAHCAGCPPPAASPSGSLHMGQVTAACSVKPHMKSSSSRDALLCIGCYAEWLLGQKCATKGARPSSHQQNRSPGGSAFAASSLTMPG